MTPIPPEARAGVSDVQRGETVLTAYSKLRKLLIHGHYKPGFRLSQEQLIGDLGVGRTPLREALRMLEANGLVRLEPNRGVTVAETPLESAEEYYAIRLLLEPPVLSTICTDFTKPELKEMRARLDRMEQTIDRHKEFQNAHLEFHLISLSRYGNEALRAIVLDLHDEVFRHQQAYLSRPRVPNDFIGLDRLLLEAISERQADRVKRLLEFHLVDAAVGLILDEEPGHIFGPLLTACVSCGIVLRTREDGRVERPASFSWSGRRPDLPRLETANLRYAPRSNASRSSR